MQMHHATWKERERVLTRLCKQTSRLITTLHERGVQTLVIGDVRDIRQDNDKGAVANQKIHQWSAGKVWFYLTYKAARRGMQVVLQDEHYTSKTCKTYAPTPGHRFFPEPVSPAGPCYLSGWSALAAAHSPICFPMVVPTSVEVR